MFISNPGREGKDESLEASSTDVLLQTQRVTPNRSGRTMHWRLMNWHGRSSWDGSWFGWTRPTYRPWIQGAAAICELNIIYPVEKKSTACDLAFRRAPDISRFLNLETGPAKSQNAKQPECHVQGERSSTVYRVLVRSRPTVAVAFRLFEHDGGEKRQG